MTFLDSGPNPGRDWLVEISRLRDRLWQAGELGDCEAILKSFMLMQGRMPSEVLDRVDDIYRTRLADLLGCNADVPIVEGFPRSQRAAAPSRPVFPVPAVVFWTRAALVFLLAALAFQLLIPYYLNHFVFARMTFGPPNLGPDPVIRPFKSIARPLQ